MGDTEQNSVVTNQPSTPGRSISPAPTPAQMERPSSERWGRIDAFDDSLETWSAYARRLTHYFNANQVPQDRKVSCLLSLLGPTVYGTLENLIFPALPTSKQFEEIVEILENHYEQKPLLVHERFTFWYRNQKESESIKAYTCELRRLSKTCKLVHFLDQALRDKLVCGLRTFSIQKRLLQEDDISFEKAMQIAISMESADKKQPDLKNRLQDLKVNKVSNPQGKTKPCYRCGKKGHKPSDCRFKDAECHNCKKTGHIQSACRSKQGKGESKKKFQKSKSKKVHALEEDSSDSDFVSSLTSVKTLNKQGSQPARVTPRVNGKLINMEIDTGSPISLLSKDDYDKYFKEQS
ncbi:uncharacterized protein [Ptychodera flava]|uniref:uncharacterized protein n=1 Tax=Ptychodera flava TaxID=63121 RepID=UPI00396AAD3A